MCSPSTAHWVGARAVWWAGSELGRVSEMSPDVITEGDNDESAEQIKSAAGSCPRSLPTDAVGTAMKNTIDNKNSHARTHDLDRKIDIQDDAASTATTTERKICSN